MYLLTRVRLDRTAALMFVSVYLFVYLPPPVSVDIGLASWKQSSLANEDTLLNCLSTWLLWNPPGCCGDGVRSPSNKPSLIIKSFSAMSGVGGGSSTSGILHVSGNGGKIFGGAFAVFSQR